MKDIRCLILGHKWKKERIEDSVYLLCVRCTAESQPGNFDGRIGAGF